MDIPKVDILPRLTIIVGSPKIQNMIWIMKWKIVSSIRQNYARSKHLSVVLAGTLKGDRSQFIRNKKRAGLLACPPPP
jgi:hypothetical protein